MLFEHISVMQEKDVRIPGLLYLISIKENYEHSHLYKSEVRGGVALRRPLEERNYSPLTQWREKQRHLFEELLHRSSGAVPEWSLRAVSVLTRDKKGLPASDRVNFTALTRHSFSKINVAPPYPLSRGNKNAIPTPTTQTTDVTANAAQTPSNTAPWSKSNVAWGSCPRNSG